MLTHHFLDNLWMEQSTTVVTITANSYCHLQNVLQQLDSSINMMMTNSIKTCKSMDPKEELLIDLDATIKETKLTVGTLIQVKQTIMDNPNIILDTFCSSLSQFTIEPTFPFLEFIQWVVKNYVPSTKKILSTDRTIVTATINLESLRKAFYLPVPNRN